MQERTVESTRNPKQSYGNMVPLLARLAMEMKRLACQAPGVMVERHLRGGAILQLKRLQSVPKYMLIISRTGIPVGDVELKTFRSYFKVPEDAVQHINNELFKVGIVWAENEPAPV